MVIALDVSAARPGDVLAGTSPIAELLESLHVLAEPDHHAEARGWTERITAALDPALRHDLQHFSPLWARYRTRLFYPLVKTLNRSLTDEFADIGELPEDQFVDLIAEGLQGREAKAEGAGPPLDDLRWVAYCYQRSEGRGELADQLVADPSGLRERLLDLLRRCEEAFFAAEWSNSRARLEAASAALTDRLQTDDLLPILSSLSRIASTRGSSTTVFFDKLQTGGASVDSRGLLLIPSLRGWPHLMLKANAGLPAVLQFPAQEAATPAQGSTQEAMRTRLLVLAEPGRWELSRHLIGESITTTELARRTRQSAPAVSRHLRIMREAGLVTSQRDGRQVFHRMHPIVILSLGQDVLSAIIR